MSKTNLLFICTGNRDRSPTAEDLFSALQRLHGKVCGREQLTVVLENRPGTLAHMAKVLADAKVNVLAPLGSTAVAQGSVQVVVDNVNKAKKALGGAGLSFTDKPGALAELAGRLAEKGINIDCAYATMPKGAKNALHHGEGVSVAPLLKRRNKIPRDLIRSVAGRVRVKGILIRIQVDLPSGQSERNERLPNS